MVMERLSDCCYMMKHGEKKILDVYEKKPLVLTLERGNIHRSYLYLTIF